MKTEKNFGCKTFWIIVSAMLTVFVVLSGIMLISINNTLDDVTEEPRIMTEETLQDGNQTDTSYEAIRDRVDGINGNYGENIKSQYAGEKSTMQRLTEHRMTIAAIKDVFFIGLIVLSVLLVLTKGFGIVLFRGKKNKEPASEYIDIKVPEENPSKESESNPASCGEKEDLSESVQDMTKEEISEHRHQKPTTEDSEKPHYTDDEEVAESCKLF